MDKKCLPLGWLYRYADKELDEVKAKRVEAHLKECLVCQKTITQINNLNGNIQKSFEQEKLPVGFEQRLHLRLGGPKTHGSLFLFPRIVFVVGAAVAVLFVTFSFDRTGLTGGPKEVKNTQIEKKVIDNVAKDALNYL